MRQFKIVTKGAQGVALFSVLGVITITAIITSSLLFHVTARYRMSARSLNLEQAFSLAEAGAERVALQVANGRESTFQETEELGNGNYVANVTATPRGGGVYDIDIVSVGTVNGVSRTVTMLGVRQVSWARYALWYNREMVTPIWMVPGERFDGRVYSKPQLAFHDKDLATKGQVVFKDRAWSTAKDIKLQSNKVSPIFENGVVLSAPIELMASIDFVDLESKANDGGIIYEGETTIVLDNNKIKVTNAKLNLNNTQVNLPANGLVFIKSYNTGTGKTAKTYPGTLNISGPNGLNGRLTIAAEDDITISNHVRYKKNPATTPSSTDAFGLIGKKNVIIGLTAPNDLEVYAHIICKDGGFGVKDYDKGKARGILTVYGGIVNEMRNAVGTTGNTGYLKNYIYDLRFAKNPPPLYPKLADEIEWTEWNG